MDKICKNVAGIFRAKREGASREFRPIARLGTNVKEQLPKSLSRMSKEVLNATIRLLTPS